MTNSGMEALQYVEQKMEIRSLAPIENGPTISLCGALQPKIRGDYARMAHSFEEVWQKAQEQQIDLRSAAYLLAVQRVASAIDQRGIFP